MVAPPGDEDAWSAARTQANATAEAVAFAREVGSTPGNVANPDWMEEKAREVADRYGLTMEVLDAEALRERGMGGILAVGAGAVSPPRLVRPELGRRPAPGSPWWEKA